MCVISDWLIFFVVVIIAEFSLILKREAQLYILHVRHNVTASLQLRS